MLVISDNSNQNIERKLKFLGGERSGNIWLIGPAIKYYKYYGRQCRKFGTQKLKYNSTNNEEPIFKNIVLSEFFPFV